MNRNENNILYFILFTLSSLSLSECIATYSIDLSSEFVKVAIVKPGVPMEIALNGESQRKTPAVVYIKGDDRLFGDPAMNMGVKNPKNLYHSITTLIGKNIEHSIVQDFIKNFPYYELFMDDNNQLSFKDGINIFTVEELLAMILENAKNIAETYSEMPMKEGIIVLPPYFTQDERLAVIRSAEIAGISVLQLMNCNTAVALNYGIFRRKSFNSTVQYYMFYDVGSSATVASIIGYQVVKTKEFGMLAESPQLSVIGIGYDRTLGASQFALRLQMHIAKAFNAAKKTKTDVITVPRSMAKLYKEAVRVLKVLSANSDTYAQIENVLDDKDFKLKITRTEFEELCNDLFDRFSEPIHKALESAQIPMPNVNEIILMGGGTRIPRIQEILLKTSDRKELGKGINTDEAAALGAVYQAAFITPGFKVQNFLIKDSNLVRISVDFNRHGAQDNKVNLISTTKVLFDLMSQFPAKKVLTFNNQVKNFDFNVTQGGNIGIDKRMLFHVSVDNLTDVYNEYMKPSDVYVTEKKGVKAHFGMNNSGLFNINYIEAIFERKREKVNEKEETSAFEKLGNTISNFFGSSSDEKVDDKIKEKTEDVDKKTNEKEKENIIKNSTEVPSNDTVGNQTIANVTETKLNESKTTKPNIQVIHQNVHFVMTWKSLEIPSESVTEKSRQKIIKLKSRDEQKVALEKAKNELESFIFDVKSRFEKEIFVTCSTESERSAALSEAQRTSEWYEEQGVSTTIEEYTAKYNGLMKMVKDIDYRVKELNGRPEVISKMNTMLNTSNMFLINLVNVTGDEAGKIFTKAEYNSLERLITDTTKWMINTNKTFESMKLYENPTVTLADFDPYLYGLERELSYLFNKITTWRNQTPPPTSSPPPPPPTSQKTSTSSEKTSKDDQTLNRSESETPVKDSGPVPVDSTKNKQPPVTDKKKEERLEL